jgi:hypothetical protein
MAAVSRRALLLTGTGAAALALTPLGWLQSAVAASSAIPSRAAFAGCLGATFRVSANAGAVDAVLTEVSDLTPVNTANDPNRFSLIFRLSGQLAQGVYSFRQTKIGTCQLFAVPVDRGAQGRYLQVVINR